MVMNKERKQEDRGMIVVLNKVEQRLVEFVAKQRYKHDRDVGAQATVYGNEGSLEREINSVGAEVAFCKHQNIWPDLDPNHFGIEDSLLPNAKLVDVKTTTRHNGRLLVKAIQRKGVSDLYAMMVGTFPTYRFAGWMKHSELIVDERIDKKLPHPAYAANQSELKKGEVINEQTAGAHD